MHRSHFAAALASALFAVPDPVMQAMRNDSKTRNWSPSTYQHSHRGHGAGHAGKADKRKARNRRRNKIARASRRRNRA